MLFRDITNEDELFGPISYLDCVVFCILLAPQLILQAGLVPTIRCVWEALPFVCTFLVLCLTRVLRSTPLLCLYAKPKAGADNEIWHKVLKLPIQFIFERWVLPYEYRSRFVQKASPFEDYVIRCVRYAFANIPPNIGRVFFSKQVALPFFKYRVLRHGYWECPMRLTEYNTVSAICCLSQAVD